MRNMEIGKTLERMREERQLRAADVAARIGMSRSYVSRCESGEITPSLDALEKFAVAIGVKLCEIVARAEGVAIVIREETREQAATRHLMESLDAQQRYKLEAIAEILRNDPPEPS